MSKIKTGFWQDHELEGLQSYQYLLAEREVRFISNAVAVTLTLALPRIYILLQRSMPGLSNMARRRIRSEPLTRYLQPMKGFLCKVHASFGRNESNTNSEESPLELVTATRPKRDYESRILTGTLATIQNATTTEDAVSRLARRHLAMSRLSVGNSATGSQGLRQVFNNITAEPKASAYILIIMCLLFAVYVGIQVIAVSSSFIIGGSTSTFEGGMCTYYVPGRWSNNSEILGFSAHHGHQSFITETALFYADACYNPCQSKTSCPKSMTRRIQYNTSTDSICPFPNKTMCKFGNSAVLTMDSGFIDANILGINSKSPFEFRRRTTCSPLIDDQTFVQSRNLGGNLSELTYRYDNDRHSLKISPNWNSIYTFREKRDLNYNEILGRMSGMDSLAANFRYENAYDVQVIQVPLSQWSMFNYGNDRRLSSDLVGPGTATTLFLVGTGNIQYYAKSDDPIFPAQHMIHGSWPRENRWSHVGIARTILGCVDEKIVRDNERKQEWYLLNGQLHDASTQTWNITPPAIVDQNDTPYSDTDFTVLQLLCLALRYSDTASAAMFAGTKWLNVASRVVELPEGRFSLPLDKNQWQLEAQKLFNVSLARMQIEIIGMTQDVAYPNYTDPEAMLENYFHNRSMNPCGLIKLNAEGWQNVSVVGFVGMIGLAVGLWTVTMEVGSTIVLVWLYKSVVKPALVSMLVGMQNAYRLTARGFQWGFQRTR